MSQPSNIVGVTEDSIVRHGPLNPDPNVVYREYDTQPGAGGGGAAAATGLLAHPLVLLLAVLGLIVYVLYMFYQGVIKPLVRWIFKIGPPVEDAKEPRATDIATARERIGREHEAIERAMQTDPDDPALTKRMEKLIAEVERVDRVVVQALNEQALRPFSEITEGRPPKHPGRHYESSTAQQRRPR